MYFSLILHATFSLIDTIHKFSARALRLSLRILFCLLLTQLTFLSLLDALVFFSLSTFSQGKIINIQKNNVFLSVSVFSNLALHVFFSQRRDAPKNEFYHEESITVLLCQKSFIQRGQTLQIFVCVCFVVVLEPLNLF